VYSLGRWILVACFSGTTVLGFVSSTEAQQGPKGDPTVQAAQPAVVINYRERPRVPFDPQRLKLRPTLDGRIGTEEWTPLYTISEGAVTGTVYLNWDEDGLYVASKTAQPAWVVVDLDTSGDGWLRGADNVEIVVAPVNVTGAAPLTVRILDAATNRDMPSWNDTVVEPRQIQLAVQQDGGIQVVECGVPKGVGGVAPKAGALIGARVDFLPAGTVPVATAPYEPHLLLDLTLVEARAVAAGGVVGRLKLSDVALVPGQTFNATFELINQIDVARQIRSVTWSGVGAAGDYLKSLREVALPKIAPLKTTKLRYSSPLPETALPGQYQFTVSAVLDDGTTVSSTGGFSIEEAFSIQLECDVPEVTVIGPTTVKLVATISSAVPGFKRADVTLTTPVSWEVKGKPRRSVNIHRENGTARAVYHVTIPSATQAGEYKVSAEVEWRGKRWIAHRTLKVSRPQQSP